MGAPNAGGVLDTCDGDRGGKVCTGCWCLIEEREGDVGGCDVGGEMVADGGVLGLN